MRSGQSWLKKSVAMAFAFGRKAESRRCIGRGSGGVASSVVEVKA